MQIIRFYLNLIKFWSQLGSELNFLSQITREIKSYFLKREDTLRCIISVWIAELYSNENTKKEQQYINVPINDEGENSSDQDENSQLSEIEIQDARAR